MKKLLLSAAVIAVATSPALAITITGTEDANQLADALFLNQPDLTVEGATLFSAAMDPEAFVEGDQAGTYTNEAGTYGLPSGGIVLSTGNVSDYETGTNELAGFSTAYDGFPTTDQTQQDLLEPITGVQTHFDVVQLDIDFSVSEDVDTVTFFAVFGSEEFPEFTLQGFSDAFGLYVNGTNVAGAVPTGEETPLAINIDHPDMTAIAGTELDGILAPDGNPILRFDVPVNAGEMNAFTIILADATDNIYDTTVYLSSFFADVGGPSNGGTGGSEFDPVLPSNPPDPETGEFIILLPEVPPFQTLWVDPPVSVGFVYEVEGTEFATVSAPSLATVADIDGYFLTVGATTVAIAAGQTIDLLAVFGMTTSSFSLTGIDPALMLDPANPLAFPLGLSFTSTVSAGTQLSITPITQNIGGPDDPVNPVPLPAAGLLYGFGLAGGSMVLRRRRKKRS